MLYLSNFTLAFVAILLVSCGSHTVRDAAPAESVVNGCLESDCPCMERTAQGLLDENGVAALDVVRPLLVAIEKRCRATRGSEAALLLDHKTSPGGEAFGLRTCESDADCIPPESCAEGICILDVVPRPSMDVQWRTTPCYLISEDRVLQEYAFFTGTCLSRQEAQQRCQESTPDNAICDAVRRKW
ncbi:MAG: hypothetical protein AAFV32_06090 [Myxococcota bacterium]